MLIVKRCVSKITTQKKLFTKAHLSPRGPNTEENVILSEKRLFVCLSVEGPLASLQSQQ